MTMDITQVTNLSDCYFRIINDSEEVEGILVEVVTKDFWNANHHLDYASLESIDMGSLGLFELMEALYEVILPGNCDPATLDQISNVATYLTSLGMEQFDSEDN